MILRGMESWSVSIIGVGVFIWRINVYKICINISNFYLVNLSSYFEFVVLVSSVIYVGIEYNVVGIFDFVYGFICLLLKCKDMIVILWWDLSFGKKFGLNYVKL